MRFVVLAVVGLLVALDASRGLTAQQSGEPQPAQSSSRPLQDGPADTNSAAVQEAKLKTYYLKRKDGELAAFFDMPYEEFVEIFKLYRANREPQTPDRFVLHRMDVRGEAFESHVELEVEFDILTNADQWIRVPLRMGRSILREEIRDADDASEHYLSYEDETNGYVCWIKGKQDERFKIRLKVVRPLQRVGDETTLQIALPRATFSDAQIQLPIRNAVAQLNSETTFYITEPLENGHTRLEIFGAAGDLEATWRPGSAQASSSQIKLITSSETVASIEGLHSISYTSVVEVRSLAHSFDSFIVRLPPGAELIQVGQPGITFSIMRPEDHPMISPLSESQYVRVQLDKPANKPVKVSLHAFLNRPSRGFGPTAATDVSGFEVWNAVRQTGTIEVRASDQWQVDWTPDEFVRRVGLPPDRQIESGTLARFQFFQQPYSLRVRVAQKQRQIRVEPQYVLFIEKNEIRLEGEFKYQLAGPQADSFRVHLNGWILEQVQPEQAVDRNVADQSSFLISPSRLAQPAGEPIRIKFVARMTIDGLQESTKLPLPYTAEATSVDPALVVLVPDDNVEIQPDLENMPGFSTQTLPPTVQLPTRQLPPLVYRAVSEDDRLTVQMRLRPRSQSVRSDVSVEVDLNDSRALVRHHFDLIVLYEPLRELRLNVPLEAFHDPNFRVEVDGEPIWSHGNQKVTPDEVLEGRSLLDINLAQGLIGEHQLTVSYVIPIGNGTPAGEPETLPVPLIFLVHKNADMYVPQALMSINPTLNLVSSFGDFQIVNHFSSLTVSHPSSMQVTPDSQAWSAAQETSGTSRWSTVYHPVGDVESEQIKLDFNRLADQSFRQTIIDKLWLQSWFSNQSRQDRATFRLRTREQRLVIVLPNGAVLSGAAVDGVPIAASTIRSQNHQVTIELPSVDVETEYSVELWYRVPRENAEGDMVIAAPVIPGTDWIGQFYWQAILPPDEHLVFHPEGLTPEHSWQWQGWYWGRRSKLDCADLERLMNVPARDAVVGQRNEYLFVGFGAIGSFKVAPFKRKYLLLSITGAVFLLGAILVYWPIHRQSWVLIGGAALLAGTAYGFPQWALPVAQVSCVAVVFVVSMYFLRNAVYNRRQWRSTSSRPESVATVTQEMAIQQPSSGHASTAEPVVVKSSSVESNS